MRIILSIAFALSLNVAEGVRASNAASVLHFDQPAKVWEKGGLPIGNGALGGVLFGGVDRAVMQFNVDSLWTGDENPSGKYDEKGMGFYQNFGNLVFGNRWEPMSLSQSILISVQSSDQFHCNICPVSNMLCEPVFQILFRCYSKGYSVWFDLDT